MFNIFSRTPQKSYEQGVIDERSAAQARRAQFHHEELSRCINAPVIIVPNEWDNPVIGFGASIMEVGSSSVLVVKNYLSMEEVVCGGVRMDFSLQRLEVALTLDPYQLWAITAHNSVGHSDFDKPKSGQRWSREKILSTLTENGFFKRWEKFLQAELQSQD